MTHISKRK